MATYYISGSGSSGGDGSSGNPWRQPSQAMNTVSDGDTVILRNGTYQKLRISKAGTTWKAEVGHTPVLDGGYSAALFTGSGKNRKLPNPTVQDAGIDIVAERVTIDGLIVQNFTGVGFEIRKPFTVIRNCVSYFTYSTGIRSNIPSDKNVHSCVIENNIVVFASMMLFDPNRKQNTKNESDQSVAGAIKVGNCRGGMILRGNTICFGGGEGLNFDKFNDTALNPELNIVEGNVIWDNNHTGLYINRARDVIVRNNQVFTTANGLMAHKGKMNTPRGINITDEANHSINSARVWCYNNIVVNCAPAYWVSVQDAKNQRVTDIYLGFNTGIAGPNTWANEKLTTSERRGDRVFRLSFGTNDSTGIIENNIFDTNGWDIEIASGEPSAMTFRNNTWSVAPPTGFRGPNDRVGQTNLRSPGTMPMMTGTYPEKVVNWLDTNFGHTFDPRNYQLTGASGNAINSASDGSTVKGVVPPVLPRQRDFFGRSRSQPDNGFHEYDGTVVTDPSVTAVMILNPTTLLAGGSVSGDASASVAEFTTITGYTWDWGDGAISSGVTAAHTYTQPGNYTVSLTVSTAAGISGTKVQLVTVQAIDTPPGEAKTLIVVARAGMNTSAGTQTITAPALGSRVPKGMLVVLSGGVATGTAANGSLLGIGATDGGRQWVQTRFAANGVGPSNSARRWSPSAVIMSIDGDGAVTGLASHVGFVPGGVTLNITDGFPDGYMAHVMFFAGEDVSVLADSVRGAPANASRTISTGFEATALIGASVWADPDTATPGAEINIGLATPNDSDMLLMNEDRDGQATSFVRGRHRYLFGLYNASNFYGITEVQNWTGNSFDMKFRTSDMSSVWQSFLALRAGAVQLSTVGTGTSGSSAYPTEAITPQAVLAVLSGLVVRDATASGDTAESFGVFMGDDHGPSQYTASVATEYGGAPTATRSLSDDKLRLVTPDGGSLYSGSVALDAGEVAVTWDSPPAVDHTMILMSFQQGELVDDPPDPPDNPPPVADFKANVQQATVPFIVRFESLSSESGGGALTYLWEFGDGTTSTQATPYKIYDVPGTYTVKLTVTNSHGTASVEKDSFIGANEEQYEEIIVGPFVPSDQDESTVTYAGIYLEEEWREDERIGSLTIGDATNVLRLAEMSQAEIEERAESPDPERAIFCWDTTNHRPAVIETDGTVRYGAAFS